MFTVLILLYLCNITKGEENLESRRTSLAQLPLEKLLHVKQALSSKGMYEKGDTELVEIEEEGALPLRSADWERRRRKKPARRGDSWDDEKESKGKGDISSIFQSTVTVLSFLAFGGYLLALIVQAVKTNSTGTMPGVVMPTAAPAAIIGRKRRKRAVEEGMVQTLHQIAEAYATYSLANDSKQNG